MQMKTYKWWIIVINLLLLLVYFAYSVASKEDLTKNGRLILLELAPVDPRSLLQGDYMDLRYKISEEVNYQNIPKNGYCVVTLNDKNIAKRVRFQPHKQALNEGEYVIKYTAKNSWQINIGAESYFFQEGHAKKYEAAKYGGLRIDENGNSLLIGLYNEDLQKIE